MALDMREALSGKLFNGGMQRVHFPKDTSMRWEDEHGTNYPEVLRKCPAQVSRP